MGEVIGELLPLAVGVAISPVPIIAVILMLLAPRAGGTSFGFLIGWLVGIVVATSVFVFTAEQADMGTSNDPSSTSSWTRLLIGAALAWLGLKQWRSRPAPGEQAKLPGWMKAIDKVTPVKATGLGFLLSAVNPKNLAMCAAAGVAIAAGGLSGGDYVGVIAFFTVVAGCTVAVPVLGYAVARQRMAGPLDRLKIWLQANNAVVMGVLLIVIGAVLIGKGIGGL